MQDRSPLQLAVRGGAYHRPFLHASINHDPLGQSTFRKGPKSLFPRQAPKPYLWRKNYALVNVTTALILVRWGFRAAVATPSLTLVTELNSFEEDAWQCKMW